MLIDYVLGQTSVVLRVKVRQDNTGTKPGQGFTGLTNASTGLIVSTIADNEATPTVYTAAGATIDTIATLGTYAAPTAGHCRLKKIDDTNNPGLVELQLENSRFAVANSKELTITISGVSGLADCDLKIPLRSVNPYSANAFMTGVNAIAPPTNWNLMAIDASGRVDLGKILGTASAGTAGYVGLDWGHITAPTTTINLSGTTIGTVTANSDKTGYSLASAPPTAAAIATAVWTDTTAGDFTTTGSPGKTLIGQLGGTFTTSTSSVFSGTSLANAPTGSGATPAAIATAVWQDLTASSDFSTANSIGALLKDKTGYSLASSGLDAITVETGVNMRQAMSPILAALAGLVSGAGTGSITFKGGNVTTTRITATTDTNGNRTAVTLSLPT